MDSTPACKKVVHDVALSSLLATAIEFRVAGISID
jgi:hypothetical protein